MFWNEVFKRHNVSIPGDCADADTGLAGVNASQVFFPEPARSRSLEFDEVPERGHEAGLASKDRPGRFRLGGERWLA
jgi:hypothetical protein